VLDEWKQVTPEQRTSLVDEKMQSFQVPDEWVQDVRRAALMKACGAWKNWKYMLNKNYVQQQKEPFGHYPMITHDDWEKFVEMKTTSEFHRKSVEHKALVAKNKHPHRMGTKGYYGKKRQWEKEDEEARMWGVDPPFVEVDTDRARYWCRGRSTTDSSGQRSFQNPADQEVYEQLVRSITLNDLII
jgi:hypothetical protein